MSEIKQGWWQKLKSGLKKSSDRIEDGLKNIFVRRRLDQETLDQLEELLIINDLGVETASRLTRELGKQKLDKEVTELEIKEFLQQQIEEILTPYAKPLDIDKSHSPHVVLVVGVNGSGKTTTIGKLGKHWQDQGLNVHFAAGDTFRAAAVAQLEIWAQRLNIPLYKTTDGGDAAALAYTAIEQAKAAHADLLFIDTAGRLHNKSTLMDELSKILRVIKKVDGSAPHSVLLVLDATTGQNAHSQVEVFKQIANITGLIITKLDGTAKGGVIISLAAKHKLPIHAIGVGETVEDLRPFTAQDFARTLVGIDS